jgi:hypothetical protein
MSVCADASSDNKDFLHLVAIFVGVIDPNTRQLTFEEPLNVLSLLFNSCCVPVQPLFRCPSYSTPLRLLFLPVQLPLSLRFASSCESRGSVVEQIRTFIVVGTQRLSCGLSASLQSR